MVKNKKLGPVVYNRIEVRSEEKEATEKERVKKKMAWRAQISKNLKELRILLCQSSPSSSATRAFIDNNYKDLKTHNPKLPILIREAKGIQPQLWARFDMGVERGVRLEGLSEAQISKALEELVKVGESAKA